MRWITWVSLALFAIPSFAAVPTLVVEGDDGNVALELSAVAIRVTVRGHLARTSYELTYRNSLDRETGGDFTFPLPPDAEVSDLGLYFDGVLRHAVAVERVLARTAYEEIVHRNVDPAIAEWSNSRSFRLDVYPIPPRGEKKVYLAYDQELTREDYTLDVSYRDTVKSFDVQIDAGGAAVSEENGVIRIARDPRETAFAARSDEDGKWYGSAAIDLAPARREAPPAAHTVILYDTSSSSARQDSARLQEFLAAFLARQQAWSTAEVVPFHIGLDDARPIRNAAQPAAARELERILGDLQPLGATNLMAVVARLPKLVDTLPPSARIVLVTDGVTSLGDSRNLSAAIGKLASLGRPLLVVHAAESADDHLLARAARATGGWSVDLLRTSVEDAVAQAMVLPTATRLDGMAPSVLLTSGAARAAVAMRTRDPITMLYERPVRVLESEVEGSMIRRAWARARLREMLLAGASDEELIAHGRVYTQLTPRTSLLVLENFWDYMQYDIPLPPDLEREWVKWENEQNAPSVRRHLLPLPPPNVKLGGWFIRGRILDVTGVPLPGVTVRLLDDKATIAAAVTDENGVYAVGSASAPRNPVLVADLEGFQQSRSALADDVPAGAVLDMLLKLSFVSETITVTAAAPKVGTTSSMSAMTRASLRRIAFAGGDDELTQRLRATSSISERLRLYLDARPHLDGNKGFHVFAAQAFRDDAPEIAVRVLSDLAEARPDDAPLLRILARVLDGWGEPEIARLLLERAIELSPTEPQSWREMILLEARHGRPASVNAWARRMSAAQKRDGMNEVYEQTNATLARWSRASFADRFGGVDLRADGELTIDLMYDTGWAYVDLHVTEPNGHKVLWSDPASTTGATLTGGYTFGFGPQIYSIGSAPRGTYHVAMDYYSADDTNVSRESLVHVIVHQRGERRDYFFVMREEKENQPLTTIEMR